MGQCETRSWNSILTLRLMGLWIIKEITHTTNVKPWIIKINGATVFVLIITGCKKLMQITKCLHCTARNVFCMYCKNCNKCFGACGDMQIPPVAVPTKLKTALNDETDVIYNVVDIFSFHIFKCIDCNTNTPCPFPCH
jgi:hypothetical protein